MKTIERRLLKLENVVSKFPADVEELSPEAERLLLIREIDEFLRDLVFIEDDDAEVDAADVGDAEAPDDADDDDDDDDDFWDALLKGGDRK